MSNVLDLSKKFELNLQKAGFTTIPTMRTRLAVDKSGSMSQLYSQGFVEKVIELFLGAAAKFDDNGELEYTFFNTSADSMQTVGVDNYSEMRIPDPYTGTNYVPALKEMTDIGSSKASGVFSKIFGGKTDSSKEEPPVYLGFITDGEPNDYNESVKFLNSIKDTKNFVQFIVLGNDVSPSIMETFAQSSNVSYSVIENPSKMNVDELYDIIANQKLLAWTKAL